MFRLCLLLITPVLVVFPSLTSASTQPGPWQYRVQYVGSDHTIPPEERGPFDTLEAAEAFERNTHQTRALNALAYSLPCADGTISMLVRPDATIVEHDYVQGDYFAERPGEVEPGDQQTQYMAWIDRWNINFPLPHGTIFQGYLGCPYLGVAPPWNEGAGYDPNSNDGWCAFGDEDIAHAPDSLRKSLEIRHQAAGTSNLTLIADQGPIQQQVVANLPPFIYGQPIPAADPQGRLGAMLVNYTLPSPFGPQHRPPTQLRWKMWWGGGQTTNPPSEVAPILTRQTVWCPSAAVGVLPGNPRAQACRLTTGHGNLQPNACVNAGASSSIKAFPAQPKGFAASSKIEGPTRQTNSCELVRSGQPVQPCNRQQIGHGD